MGHTYLIRKLNRSGNSDLYSANQCSIDAIIFFIIIILHCALALPRLKLLSDIAALL